MALIRPQEDIALIEAFRKGNTRPLDNFYLKHREAFLKWIAKEYRLSGDDAKDVYQDAFLVLHRNLETDKLGEIGASLKVYLFGIGKNITRKRLEGGVKEGAAGAAAQREWEDGDAADLNERQLLAMHLYDQLTEPCKSIIRLYYYEKLSMREIARQMGYKSEDVAKNQKARCLKTAREMLSTMPNRQA